MRNEYNPVQSLYDNQPEVEWSRLDRHRTEYAVTLRAMHQYLPQPPKSILDCGGGPGRYAIELTRQGYEVTLFDLSNENLLLAKTKAAEAGVEIKEYQQGNATYLSCFKTDSFDVVLHMGPLYHLLQNEEREQAVREAYRVVKPGGVVLFAFISRYAAHRFMAAHEPKQLYTDQEISNLLLNTGCLYPRQPGRFFAYFAHPEEVPPLIKSAGFEIQAILGVEGLISQIEEGVNQLNGEAWDAWVDLNYRLSTDPSLHGCAEHLLAVAIKPQWKSVVKKIANRLDNSGIYYKMVGGVSAVLNGVDIAVNDLDLESTAEYVIKIANVFNDDILLPVEMRESDIYRSWFGKLLIDNIRVDLMGELQRRENDRWVPSSSKTEKIVKLEGCPVRVSWLEEEMLAYIRRGRLERAARCLEHCDQQRLLTLLRDIEAINVV